MQDIYQLFNLSEEKLDYLKRPLSETEKAKARFIFCQARDEYQRSNMKAIEFNGDTYEFDALLLLAKSFFQDLKINESIHTFLHLLEEYPYSWEVNRYIGIIYGMLGKDERHALDYLEFSSSLLGGDNTLKLVENMYFYALIKFNLSEYDGSLKMINLINTNPDFDELPLAGNICCLGVLCNGLLLNIDEAEKWASKSKQLGKLNSTLLLVLAHHYFSNDRYQDAYKSYIQALDLLEEGNTFIPWVDKIVNKISLTEKLKSEKHAIYCGIASYYEMIGETENAIINYLNALKIDKESISSNLRLAAIYALKGEKSKMKEYMACGIEQFNPNDPTHQIFITTLLVSDEFRSKYLRDEVLEYLVDKRVINRYLYRQLKKIKFIGAEQELEDILVLISQGEIKSALNILLSKISYNSNDTLIILNGRHSKLNLDYNKGVVSKEQYDLELNKIVMAVIDFIGDELEKVKTS